jgi:hypothetical protein
VDRSFGVSIYKGNHPVVWINPVLNKTGETVIPAPQPAEMAYAFFGSPHFGRGNSCVFGPPRFRATGYGRRHRRGQPASYRPSPTGPIEQLAIGQNVVRNEKISTFNKGQVQLIFADQSTLTLAENSEIVIDEFVYDPRQQAGTMTATVTTGVLRYVGGKISKKSDVSFLTPSGVVTVRGGIALIKVTGSPSVAPAKGAVTANKQIPAERR